MKLEIEIPEDLLKRILSYGDLELKDLSKEQLASIKSSAESEIFAQISDEPFYAYEDYVEGALNG